VNLADSDLNDRSLSRLIHSPRVSSVWAIIAAFGTYFCMYAFRKPFTAASYTWSVDIANWLVLDGKMIYVSSQVIGYTVSKFIGIKVIAEMRAERRAMAILWLIGLAEIALLFFGLVPAPWNCIFLFLNGLPLGMVFGLVLGFLEGRRVTEAWTAGLCASFILADGVTKSVGSWLLTLGVSVYWMPFCAGALFALPLLICVWMLGHIPRPSDADIEARTERVPMNGVQRREFFSRYLLGLSLLVVMYLMVTILRSMRADFAKELWEGLDYQVVPSMFTYSEMIVAAGVMLINGSAIAISDNRRGFSFAMGVALTGLVLVALALLGRTMAGMDGFWFMVCLGLGLYMPYVAVHTTVFERFIAMTRDKGNIGYLLYVADAIGYLGYVAVMFGKGGVSKDINFMTFFTSLAWIIVFIGIVCVILSWYSLMSKTKINALSSESTSGRNDT